MQDIKFDILLPKINAQTPSRVFRIISEKMASVCGADAESILKICEQDLKDRVFSPASGLAILDIKSKHVKKPVTALATLDKPVIFDALKGQSTDMVAVLLSPTSHGPFHLQRLAPLTRALSDSAICNALRGAEDQDAMRALFIPPTSEAA